MNVIVCLDDKNGILFNGRRQSADAQLRKRIISITAGKKLWMNSYSAKQFSEENAEITVDEDFLKKAQKGDFCFVENSDITEYIEKAENIIVYRWNRIYPSDRKFPALLLDAERLKKDCFEFEGSSHKKITEEIYCYEA